MIYNNIELKCTETELQNFIDSISVSYEIRDFSQKYNNVTIENKTGDENAKYYILEIEGVKFLQSHSPFEQGFVAITDANVTEIIGQHKQQNIDNMIFSKFAVIEEDKQEQRIAELEAAIVAILGGM